MLIHGLSGEFKAMAKLKLKLDFSDKVNFLDFCNAGRFVNLPRAILVVVSLLSLILSSPADGQQFNTLPSASPASIKPSASSALSNQLNSIPIIPVTSKGRRDAPEFQFQSKQQAGKFRETGISQQGDFSNSKQPIFESLPQLKPDSLPSFSTKNKQGQMTRPSPSPFLPSIHPASPEPLSGISSTASPNEANSADDNTIIQRFPDGTPSIIRKVQLDENGNYRNQGAWESFDKNGQIISKGNYNDGEMDAFVGNEGSDILHFKITGSFTNPKFMEQTIPSVDLPVTTTRVLCSRTTTLSKRSRKHICRTCI